MPAFFLIFVFLLIQACAFAQTAELVPRTDIFSESDRDLVKLSGDGDTVSFVAPAPGGEAIYTAPAADATKAKPLSAPAQRVAGYEWLNGEEKVVAVMVRDGAASLVLIDAATGKELKLDIGAPPVRIERLSAKRPSEVLVAVEGGYRIVNTNTGSVTPVGMSRTFTRVIFDSRFIPAVGEDRSGDGFSLYRPKDAGAWEKFLDVPFPNSQFSRAFSVDEKGQTLYLIDNLDTDTAVLKALDIGTGKSRILARDPQADITPVPMVDPLTSRVESATSYFGDMRRHYIDDSVRKDFEYLASLRPGDVGISSRSFKGDKWLVAYLDGGPIRYFWYDRKSRKTKYLFLSHSALEGVPIAKRVMSEVKTRDGLVFPAHFYLPAETELTEQGRPAKPLPTLIYVHGGPTVAYPWNSWYTNRIFQLLADRGYAVMRIEFRGTGGFGKKIADAGNLEWGKKMQEDVSDAAQWAVSKGFADREKLGIFGWSYGGYSTLAALTFTPDEFQCGMALYPVSDLKILLDQNPVFWRIKLGDERTEEGRKHLRETSPLFFAERLSKPLLITHGGKDTRAVPVHSDRMTDELMSRGKPVTYLYYPEEVHDYRLAGNWISLFAAAEKFFAGCLGGKAQPAGDDLKKGEFEVTADRLSLVGPR
ncbi:MAG: S9 family peptidase [Acidobacteriota bacterium]|nr:MAG: S9 family peptidase [Acidobacteriota bacterium]